MLAKATAGYGGMTKRVSLHAAVQGRVNQDATGNCVNRQAGL